MNKILLISEDFVKTNSNINDNVWGKFLLPAIRDAQEMRLREIIGESLYDKLCELVSAGTISSTAYTSYKLLLDDYIQPLLLNEVLGNVIPLLNAKISNLGTVKTNDEHTTNLTQSEFDILQKYYKDRADFYAKRLQDWLLDNTDSFPELSAESLTNPHLDSAASTGIWLGGIRGNAYYESDLSSSSSSTGTSGYAKGFQDGFASGVTNQKQKLSAVTFTTNTAATRADGWSSVTVNVDTGATYESGYTSGYSSGYTSGFTSGHSSGVTEQKAKLIPALFVDNGHFTREDGWNELTIRIDTGSSYNSGYTSGKTDGIAEQKAKLVSTAVTVNGTYTKEDGFSSVTVTIDTGGTWSEGYQSGYTSGFTSGHSSGMTEQKAKLVSTAVTANGTYTKEDGYNSVTVNVPSTTTVTLTQAQYDALTVKDINTIYLING